MKINTLQPVRASLMNTARDDSPLHAGLSLTARMFDAFVRRPLRRCPH